MPKICFTKLFYLLCTLTTAIIIIIIIIIIIMVIIIITYYSKFQFKICFNKIIGFLNKSASLNTKLAAKTHLAVGEFLLITKNKKWLLRLHKGSVQQRRATF
jgi:hypothetical protein